MKPFHWCMCTKLKSVARDGKSTCSICKGIDAYGTSPGRPEGLKKKLEEEPFEFIPHPAGHRFYFPDKEIKKKAIAYLGRHDLDFKVWRESRRGLPGCWCATVYQVTEKMAKHLVRKLGCTGLPPKE